MSNQLLLGSLMRTGEPSRRVASLLLSVASMELSDAVFQEAIDCLLHGWDDIWLKHTQEVLVDPRTWPEEPMGVHGVVAPLLPFRSCILDGQRVYLFEHHIEEIAG